MRGWRVAFRLAAREAKRNRARTFLVSLLVALPVAGIVFGAATVRTLTPTAAQERAWHFGGADALFTASGEGRADLDALLASLPSGARAVIAHTTETPYNGDGGRVLTIQLSDAPATDPLTSGLRVLKRGRLAQVPGEVAVSPAVLAGAGLEVGDELELLRPRTTLRITGVAVAPAGLDAPVGLVVPGALAGMNGALTAVYVDTPNDEFLAAPVSTRRVWNIERRHQLAAGAEAEIGHSVTVATVPGGIALVVAAIVASAAMAISARRHLRQLGLLAASGATSDQLRGVMTASGSLIGGVGALIGTAVGLLALFASRPFLDRWAGHVTDGLVASPREIALAAVLGIFASTAAAWAPAFAAARIPVLSALAGRRPLGRVRRWIPITGIVVVISGTVVMGLIAALDYGADLWSFSLAGAVAVVLGATTLSPWIVSLVEPLSRRLRGNARLAVRSLVRSRTRAAAVIAAVMAAASLTMGGSALALSNGTQNADQFENSIGEDQVVVGGWNSDDQSHIARPSDVIDELKGILPGSFAAERRSVVATRRLSVEEARSVGRETIQSPVVVLFPRSALPGLPTDPIIPEGETPGGEPTLGTGVAVGTAEIVQGLAAPAATNALLAEADVVVFGPRSGKRTEVTLQFWRESVRRTTITAAVVGTDRRELWTRSLMSPSRVASLGFESVIDDILIRSPRALTGKQRDQIDALSNRLVQAEQRTAALGAPVTSTFLQRVQPVSSSRGLRMVILAVSLVFTLGVVALGVALASADGKGERALLEALGAPASSRRRISVAQAVALAVLGGLLAVPVGFGPTAVVLAVLNNPVVFPWATAIGLVLAVPAAVGLVTSAGARLFARPSASPALLAAD